MASSDAPPGFREVPDAGGAPPGWREVRPAPDGPALSGSESAYWSRRASGGQGEVAYSPFVTGLLGALGLGPGRSVMDIALNPKGLPEHVASLAVQAPLIAAGGGAGAALKIPAALGRIATAAGLGAVGAANRGEDMGWGAVIDAAVAGLTEGASKLVQVGRVPLTKISLSESGAPARAYEWATQAPGKALDMIRDYFPKGWGPWVKAPTISGKPLTLDAAVKGLAKLEGPEYEMARMEIISNLDSVEKLTGKIPGKAFEKFTSDARFTPPTSARVAEGVRTGLDENAVRAALDALAEQRVQGVPIGAGLGLGMASDLGGFARRVLPSP